LSGHLVLVLAAASFLGTHFMLSHPLRQPVIDRFGEKGFSAIYVIVAFLTFGLTIWAYHRIGREVPLWEQSDGLWIAASLLMWFASILFVGSFQGNPAFPRRPGSAPIANIPSPRGVFAITRHPMMWSFAIWAIVHAAVVATPKAFILDAAILILALGGSALQEGKKRAQLGEAWHEWSLKTAFVPFTRGAAYPGTVAVVGGTLFFLLVTWVHPVPAGIWRWIG
jgi:uncharacterized membrane protein